LAGEQRNSLGAKYCQQGIVERLREKRNRSLGCIQRDLKAAERGESAWLTPTLGVDSGTHALSIEDAACRHHA